MVSAYTTQTCQNKQIQFTLDKLQKSYFDKIKITHFRIPELSSIPQKLGLFILSFQV